MTALFAIFSALTAFAALDRVAETSPIFEPRAGILMVDDGERNHDPEQGFHDTGPQRVLGVRGFAAVGGPWEIGLGYEHAGFETTRRHESSAEDTRIDTRMDAVWAEVRRAWPTRRFDIVGSAGAGLLVLDAGQFRTRRPRAGTLLPATVAPHDPEREIDPVISLGMGLRRSLGDRFAASVEARDLLHVCRGSLDDYRDASRLFCDRDALLHHFQLTAGLRVEL